MRKYWVVPFVGIWFGVLSSFAPAEMPSITAISPAGGQRGQTVEVTIQGKLGTPPLSFWSNRPELTATFPDKPDKTFSLTIPASAEPGVAFLRVTNAEGASSLRPFIIGLFPEENETEPNESISQAQSITSLPVIQNGVLNKSGDVDTYSLSLQKGQTLVAEMTANRILGSPMDAVMQIVSAEGFVVAQNDDDRGNDPLIAFEVPESGTYFLRTFGFPSTPNSTIRFSGGADWIYRLSITTGPFVDHIQPLAVTQDVKTTAQAIGWNLPDTPLVITAQSEVGVVQYLMNESANPVPLEVVTNPVLIEPNSETLISQIPVTISGQILSAGEIDSFRIEGKKGSSLVLRADARSLGSQLDPVLRLTDMDGKQLAEVDDKAGEKYDSEVTYTPKVDGPLAVEICDRFEHGSERHFYRLSIKPPETAGYTLGLAQDHYELKADGKPLEIPIIINRDKGFNDAIEVTIEGLPEGATAAAVISEPKGDSAKKVTLKIERGETASFSGPIRIGGVSKGESPITTFATPAFSNGSGTIDQIWLTLLPKPAKETEETKKE